MARPYSKTIQPPLAGMVRRSGYQNPPQFSSYFSENFWPINVADGRSVTATRPALADITSPGESVNGFIPVNGKRADGAPFQSFVATSEGSVFFWNGTVFLKATGAAADSVDTDRAVFGSPYLQHAYICVDDTAPIDFNYVTGTAVIPTASAGTFPTGCTMSAVWQGALCLAGKPNEEQLLFISRTGNAYDWDFFADIEDEGGAFSTGSQAEGLLNGPITALVSHTDDILLISTLEGLVGFYGHPRRGGEAEQISGNQVHILGQGAWAKTPDDATFFLTTLGLMRLGPEPNSIVTPVSKDKIPDELVGLTYDLTDPKVSMSYDSRWEVIHIHVRGAQKQTWLFEPRTGGFHKQSTTDDFYVLEEFKPFVGADTSGVMWGKVGS